MNTKSISTIVGFATAICLSCLGVPPASAQVVTLPAPPPGSVQGWSYAVAPYFWMPTIDTSLSAQGPRGGNVDFSTSIDIGTILRRLNFAAMIGAEARYERFSVMTDLLYMNVNNTTSESRLSSFNPGPGPIDIPRSGQLNAGTRLGTMIGSLAGGYTLLQGDWGNFDALAGIRLLNVNSTTNYNLSVAILLPNRTIGLSRNGSLTVNRTYVDGIGGVTGRINILNSKFYLPFYLDAGGGGIQFTWQAYGGIAYKIASWGDVSAGYRYLRFENGGTSQGVRDLSLSGALVALNCHFGSSPPPPPAPAPEVAMAAPAPAAAKTYLVFFDWDKATLTPRATEIIAQAAADSRSQSITTIAVNGYTDTSGAPLYNQSLSIRRARAVQGQLVADGIPASEISAQGFGDTNLLVATGPGVREPQNRRVEIVMQ